MMMSRNSMYASLNRPKHFYSTCATKASKFAIRLQNRPEIIRSTTNFGLADNWVFSSPTMNVQGFLELNNHCH